MEPPFLVLREGRAVFTVPLDELFGMLAAARQLVARHLSGDVAAAQQIAGIYEIAAGRGHRDDAERRKCIVSTYLLVQARRELEEARTVSAPPSPPPERGGRPAVEPPPVIGMCVHNVPRDLGCGKCAAVAQEAQP